MHNKIMENMYNNVNTILTIFTQHFPQEGTKILENLHDVHDIPEIGDAILQEEKDDIHQIIKILQKKTNLTQEDQVLLSEAKSLLVDIECKTSYISGNSRTNASHNITFDYDCLRALSTDQSYQHCIDFSFNKIKELFKSRLGARSGTIIYNDALNTLISTYYFTQIMDDLNENNKELVGKLIFDIANNISSEACEYLITKEQNFSKFLENYKT